MARKKRKKSISRDPYRFGDYEPYAGLGSVRNDPFSMETAHPGQALGHLPPPNLDTARRLREEMERELLMRKLAAVRRAEMASRVPPMPRGGAVVPPPEMGVGVEHPDEGMMDASIYPRGYRPVSTKNWSSGTQLPTTINYGQGLGDFLPRTGPLPVQRPPIAAPTPAAVATLPLAHGQDDPTGAAYGGLFESGSSDAGVRGLIEEGKMQARVRERAEAGVPVRGEFDQLDPQAPGGRDMIVEASKQPLYVTDDGEPIYMEDVIAVGGAARLRAISRAAKPIQEAFFKMIHRLKLSRRGRGKPPVDSAKVQSLAKKAAATGAAAGAAGLLVEDWVPEVAKTLINKRAESIKKQILPDDVQQPVPELVPNVDPRVLASEPDEVTRGPITSGGPGALPFPIYPPAKAIEKIAADPEKSTVGGTEVVEPETRAALERTWGKWTYNPRQRRDRFMKQLNSIYQKAAWLDVIASLSGQTSRSGAYIQRAVAKMEAMQMFDQEERLYNIWRDVYFAADGTYDAPANKAEAAQRARRLGASPEEVKKIYGWTEEGEDLQQWWRPADNAQGYEVTTVKGKKTKPKGEGWIMGKPPDPSTTPTTHVNWTDGDRTIYLEKGQTPHGVGHTGVWRKGVAKEPGKTNVKTIDFSENAYQNAINAGDDDETARAKAAELLFLQTKQDPDMYVHLQGVSDPTQRESARLKIDNIIDDYLKRGGSYSAAGQRGTTTTTTINMGAVD